MCFADIPQNKMLPKTDYKLYGGCGGCNSLIKKKKTASLK